jgi:GNAT superfamily N-acetyltransferase
LAKDEGRQQAGAIELRARTDADLDACARLVAAVRNVDGYPPYLPDNDYGKLLTQPTPLAAFVATAGGGVVGHVALNPCTGGTTETLACQRLGVEPAHLGIVARLFSAVDRRRQGIGRLLLRAATDASRSRGLIPVLDVWVELHAAVALYESAGWEMLGSVSVVLPSGPHDVHVLVAPTTP